MLSAWDYFYLQRLLRFDSYKKENVQGSRGCSLSLYVDKKAAQFLLASSRSTGEGCSVAGLEVDKEICPPVGSGS